MEKYKDIINLPYQKSKNHAHMSLSDRAAQFLPFSALSGYEKAIQESSRLTSDSKEISQEEKDIISSKLNYIAKNKITDQLEITYFVKDKKKKGGSYQVIKSAIRRVVDTEGKIILDSEKEIFIKDIINISGGIIDRVFNDFD